MDREIYITCNPIRIVEFLLCVTVLGFCIYFIMQEEQMHTFVLIILFGTAAAFTFLTFTDIIITSCGRRASWSIWIPITLMAALMFFLAGSLLFVQTRRNDWVMYVVTAVVCFTAGIIFLIDYMGCIYYLDEVVYCEEATPCEPHDQPIDIGEMPVLQDDTNLLKSSPPVTGPTTRRRTVGTQFTCEIVRRRKKCDCNKKKPRTQSGDQRTSVINIFPSGDARFHLSTEDLRLRNRLGDVTSVRGIRSSSADRRVRTCVNCGRILSGSSLFCNCSEDFKDDEFEMFSQAQPVNTVVNISVEPDAATT